MGNRFLIFIFIATFFLSPLDAKSEENKYLSEIAYKNAYSETAEIINREGFRMYEYNLVTAGKPEWVLEADFTKNPATGIWLSNYSISLLGTASVVDKEEKFFRIYVLKRIGRSYIRATIKYVDIGPPRPDEIRFSVSVDLNRTDLEMMRNNNSTFEVGTTGDFKWFIDEGSINGFLNRIKSYGYNWQLFKNSQVP